MILLTLDARYRDDLVFMLIEDTTLVSYDLDYGWIFYSLFIISVFVVLVDLEDLSCALFFVTDYFSYSVIEVELLWE